MRLSCVFALALTVIGLGAGADSAAALNVPPKVHRTKSSSQHLTASKHSKATATRTSSTTRRRAKSSTTRRTSATASASPRLRRTVLTHRRHRYFERFTASSFAKGDIFGGDITTGEDPLVRQAAIDALGDMNGTAVVIDPSNGRILAMVNQKLALSPGAEPCSTIKLSVALAALSEGLVTRDTPVQLAGFRMNMTDALAKSNNLYFEELGRELGFERVRHYANQFGLGELAGYHIQGEQLGIYPDTVLAASEGGVGRMCSFGQGVSMTPLQLGAFVAAMANGGTLYYLQHPTTPEEVTAFSAQSKADSGYRSLRARYAGRHGRRRRIRNRPPPARQLPGTARVRQDRHLLRQGNSLWLVCLLLRYAAGQPGDRLLPRGRTARPLVPAPPS